MLNLTHVGLYELEFTWKVKNGPSFFTNPMFFILSKFSIEHIHEFVELHYIGPFFQSKKKLCQSLTEHPECIIIHRRNLHHLIFEFKFRMPYMSCLYHDTNNFTIHVTFNETEIIKFHITFAAIGFPYTEKTKAFNKTFVNVTMHNETHLFDCLTYRMVIHFRENNLTNNLKGLLSVMINLIDSSYNYLSHKIKSLYIYSTDLGIGNYRMMYKDLLKSLTISRRGSNIGSKNISMSANSKLENIKITIRITPIISFAVVFKFAHEESRMESGALCRICYAEYCSCDVDLSTVFQFLKLNIPDFSKQKHVTNYYILVRKIEKTIFKFSYAYNSVEFIQHCIKHATVLKFGTISATENVQTIPWQDNYNSQQTSKARTK
ncbi:hypothetical protein HELRODRAFT_188917 [Helobdella robusta]|uniref:Uncharacterized protein n=1 Tax=Helobdella robusta TaxID=6412 RepID=T1FQH2_HELRO|nr:hypothetical protein HELRODRAFT_188917 [Helobdella robusta]ESN98812.1 hypothetical protein HELRODRAFT_188917 [Helobdella robusta]